jgi:hypothetical protein
MSKPAVDAACAPNPKTVVRSTMHCIYDRLRPRIADLTWPATLARGRLFSQLDLSDEAGTGTVGRRGQRGESRVALRRTKTSKAPATF